MVQSFILYFTKMKKEKSAERIVILDFRTGKVHIRPVPMSMIEEDAEVIVNYYEDILDIHSSDCTYMLVNDDDYMDDTTHEKCRIIECENKASLNRVYCPKHLK